MSLQPSVGANRKRFSAASHRQKPKEVVEAAKRDDVNTLLSLLKDGQHDPNEEEMGGTALHVAALRGYVGSLKVLIDHGANVNKVDTENWTALHAAASDGNVESVQLLAKSGANVNARDSLQRTPLLLAVLNRSVEKVKALLDLGADIKLYDEFGRGVLHYAVNEANSDLLSLLLQHGAIPDGESVANPNSETSFSPLHLAAKLGDVECVKALLAAGAVADRKDQTGLTALQYAEKEGHADVVALFSS